MTTGIYCIVNTVTGKRYVGSGVSVENRWSNHKAGLVYDKHYNRKLQNAWRKYGADAFSFELIEECAPEALVQREQYWIDHFDVVKHGYNINPRAGSCLGNKHSAKTRELMSAAAMRTVAKPDERKRRSEQAKKQHAAGKLGQKTWSAEVRATINTKIKAAALANADASGERFREYWADPKARAKQSKKLKEFTIARPEEMARRAKVYWDTMTPEARKARAAAVVVKRRKVHKAAMARVYSDPVVRAKRSEIMRQRWKDQSFRDHMSAIMRGNTHAKPKKRKKQKRSVPRYVPVEHRSPSPGCFF